MLSSFGRRARGSLPEARAGPLSPPRAARALQATALPLPGGKTEGSSVGWTNVPGCYAGTCHSFLLVATGPNVIITER